MEIRNINSLLENLVQDEESDLQVLQLTNDARSLYLACLKAGRKLPAHYHNHGSEVYQILDGNGIFELGQLATGSVQWMVHQQVAAGDIFEVPEGAVHRLTGGTEDLRLIFFTAPSHLNNDRTFIQ